MLADRLNKYRVVLASSSPRRHQFFRDLEIDFEVCPHPIDESFPPHLKGQEIAEHIALAKAEPFLGTLKDKDILITSDTIVWHDDKPLGKPRDAQEACDMLTSLSGGSHEVITAVCFTTPKLKRMVCAKTEVWFKVLTNREIMHYVNTYRPFDKAGAYGIQEWIGKVGVERIEGSYFNVMGMPVHLVYKTLIELTKC